MSSTRTVIKMITGSVPNLSLSHYVNSSLRLRSNPTRATFFSMNLRSFHGTSHAPVPSLLHSNPQKSTAAWKTRIAPYTRDLSLGAFLVAVSVVLIYITRLKIALLMESRKLREEFRNDPWLRKNQKKD